ncbi:hypothetical protein M3Y99_01717000 [Aphelenchoides fujianensis]|nr:hypothetical protein M3Y99_01717000 [Aphelenchoides fujianensis]
MEEALRSNKVHSVPLDYLINDRDVLAALADVERAKKREEELRNKSRIRRLKDTGEEWARLCSLHGIPHLAQSRSWPVGIVWAIVVVAMLAGFFYLLIDTVQQYLDYETLISVTLVNEEASFPSVTICNNSPYKASKFMRKPELFAMVQLYRSLIGLPPAPVPASFD